MKGFAWHGLIWDFLDMRHETTGRVFKYGEKDCFSSLVLLNVYSIFFRVTLYVA